jgi:hypothetical protein
MNRSLKPLVSVAAITFVSLYAQAAPVMPAESAASTTSESAPLESRGVGPAVTGGSSTIDLLIEMQPRTVGLEFNQRARATTRDGSIQRQSSNDHSGAAAPAVPSNASGLFGAGATPQVVPRKVSSEPDWKSTGDRGSIAGAQNAYRAGTDGEARMPWLPREIIGWVRDNRGTVVAGSAGLLALIWGASVALGRARH